MDRFRKIRGITFDHDTTLIDTAPGLSQAVDLSLYALELAVAGYSKNEGDVSANERDLRALP